MRSQDLPVDKRGRDPDEHEDHEQVDERHEPALVPEPRQGLVLVDRRDHRHHDRREEDEEAPEDERVHQPGDEALKELLLAEDDHRLVAGAPRHVARAVDRLARADEPPEKDGALGEEPAGDGEQRREAERARQRRYAPRAFLSSAEMAGTISWRSPMTA